MMYQTTRLTGNMTRNHEFDPEAPEYWLPFVAGLATTEEVTGGGLDQLTDVDPVLSAPDPVSRP
jgi:hypothetical protein